MLLKCASPLQLNLQPINNSHEYSGDDDPKQLEPVEEWDADELWSLDVIERWKEDDERDQQKEEKPGTALSHRAVQHEIPPFVDEM